MATVKTDSLILVVVLRQNEGYTADVSSYLGLFLDASSRGSVETRVRARLFLPASISSGLRTALLFPVIEEHARAQKTMQAINVWPWQTQYRT
jgi:hypothetical protein